MKFIEFHQNSVESPILLALHKFEVAFQLSNLEDELTLVVHTLIHQDKEPRKKN